MVGWVNGWEVITTRLYVKFLLECFPEYLNISVLCLKICMQTFICHQILKHKLDRVRLLAILSNL